MGTSCAKLRSKRNDFDSDSDISASSRSRARDRKRGGTSSPRRSPRRAGAVEDAAANFAHNDDDGVDLEGDDSAAGDSVYEDEAESIVSEASASAGGQRRSARRKTRGASSRNAGSVDGSQLSSDEAPMRRGKRTKKSGRQNSTSGVNASSGSVSRPKSRSKSKSASRSPQERPLNASGQLRRRSGSPATPTTTATSGGLVGTLTTESTSGGAGAASMSVNSKASGATSTPPRSPPQRAEQAQGPAVPGLRGFLFGAEGASPGGFELHSIFNSGSADAGESSKNAENREPQSPTRATGRSRRTRESEPPPHVGFLTAAATMASPLVASTSTTAPNSNSGLSVQQPPTTQDDKETFGWSGMFDSNAPPLPPTVRDAVGSPVTSSAEQVSSQEHLSRGVAICAFGSSSHLSDAGGAGDSGTATAAAVSNPLAAPARAGVGVFAEKDTPVKPNSASLAAVIGMSGVTSSTADADFHADLKSVSTSFPAGAEIQPTRIFTRNSSASDSFLEASKDTKEGERSFPHYSGVGPAATAYLGIPTTTSIDGKNPATPVNGAAVAIVGTSFVGGNGSDGHLSSAIGAGSAGTAAPSRANSITTSTLSRTSSTHSSSLLSRVSNFTLSGAGSPHLGGGAGGGAAMGSTSRSPHSSGFNAGGSTTGSAVSVGRASASRTPPKVQYASRRRPSAHLNPPCLTVNGSHRNELVYWLRGGVLYDNATSSSGSSGAGHSGDEPRRGSLQHQQHQQGQLGGSGVFAPPTSPPGLTPHHVMPIENRRSLRRVEIIDSNYTGRAHLFLHLLEPTLRMRNIQSIPFYVDLAAANQQSSSSGATTPPLTPAAVTPSTSKESGSPRTSPTTSPKLGPRRDTNPAVTISNAGDVLALRDLLLTHCGEFLELVDRKDWASVQAASAWFRELTLSVGLVQLASVFYQCELFAFDSNNLSARMLQCNSDAEVDTIISEMRVVTLSLLPNGSSSGSRGGSNSISGDSPSNGARASIGAAGFPSGPDPLAADGSSHRLPPEGEGALNPDGTVQTMSIRDIINSNQSRTREELLRRNREEGWQRLNELLCDFEITTLYCARFAVHGIVKRDSCWTSFVMAQQMHELQ